MSASIRKLPTVCIIGRTNVGKSTLFNALVGSRKSVVKDSPGVTRDRSYEVVSRFAHPFTLIDTGALIGEETIELHEAVQVQTRLAIKESDILVVVFDGLHGLHPLDSQVVDEVRNTKKPVLWVANKCERPDAQIVAQELYSLGIDEILCLSAAHRRGVRNLVQRIEALLVHVDLQSKESPDLVTEPAIKVAIVGKPNVGKSTFINTLLGEERLVTSPIAGTTRDSVSCFMRRDGKDYELVDTAGLRRKAAVKDGTIERFSNVRTVRSLMQCDVAMFLLDASEGLPTDQDATIINLVQEKGKSLVLVVNKWDLIEKDSNTAREYREAIKSVLHFAAFAPLVFVSAKTGQRCLNVLDAVQKVYQNSRARLKTSDVNRVFESAFRMRPPPSYHGSPVKLLYVTQVTTQPPTFAVFVNYPQGIDVSYERYIKQAIRREYPFEGSDIKLLFRRRSQLEKRKTSRGKAVKESAVEEDGDLLTSPEESL